MCWRKDLLQWLSFTSKDINVRIEKFLIKLYTINKNY